MNLALALSDLEKNTYFIWDDFLSPPEIKEMQIDFNARSDAFRKAGIGQGFEHQFKSETRTDSIDWFDPVHLNSIQTLLWERLETLKNDLNAHFFLGLWSLEGHYAKYEIGGHYQKHLDRFSRDPGRTISLILYLNSDWLASEGGELRLHPDQLPFLDILPLAGRLVCFLSAELPHEVLKTHRVRRSFAGWYRTRKA